jgi:LuxR family maltose regulon positive regulatory protein
MGIAGSAGGQPRLAGCPTRPRTSGALSRETQWKELAGLCARIASVRYGTRTWGAGMLGAEVDDYRVVGRTGMTTRASLASDARASASASVDEVPLVEAKLSPPRQRRGMVDRRHVSRMLDAGEDAELTLIAAPAGYGKTTAIRAWCAGRSAPLAWVTLDSGDNDLVRLWRYIATAVDRIRGGLGARALRRLSSLLVAIEPAVDELMNAIADFHEELVIVLDDAQALTDLDCITSIDYALDHLPANARLIMITRIDPALTLPRLRARGALAEVRAADLAFTAEETRELLVERGGLELDPNDVELLRERTEGWPAALFLAMYWLRGVEKPHMAAQEFGGDHRFVAEYLSREVIDSLDDDTRWFLLRASVLGRFTPELCDAVFARSDSGEFLAELEQSNCFVARLEYGGWFRVHSLFAEFAGFQLDAREPGAAPEIHRRAAAWLRSHGLPLEAVEHAAAAGDHEFMAGLLVEHHLRMIRNGSARALLRWVRALPDEQIVSHPELAVGAATAGLMSGQSTLERSRLLELASRTQLEHPALCTPYVQCVAAMVSAAAVDRDVGRAVVEGRRAVALAENGVDETLVAARGGLARALYLAGELDEAWTVALSAIEHPDIERRLPGHAFARSTLALIAVDRAWLESARTHAEKAKSIVGDVSSNRSWLGANASAALGRVLIEEGNLAEGERELAYAERMFGDEIATIHHAWILAVLARVRCLRGRLDEAGTALRAAHDALRELVDAGEVASLISDVEQELLEARDRANGGEVLETPSEAELAVLGLLTSDLSARQIAKELFLSPNTVHSHTRSIYRKLGVNSRADAVARADILGLLDQAQSPM